MNTEKIKDLLDLLENYSFSEVEIEEDSFKLKIKKYSESASGAINHVICPEAAQPVPSVSGDVSIDFNNMSEVKAPVAGVFYSSPSPDAPAFVKIGDKVKKGDVLCIVEAMKTMNEILSEFDGEITDCCVSNEQFVEFGQVLYKIF